MPRCWVVLVLSLGLACGLVIPGNKLTPPPKQQQHQLTGEEASTTTTSVGEKEFEYITLEHSREYNKNSRLGTTIENAPSLVLNADYSPLSFMPVRASDCQLVLRCSFFSPLLPLPPLPPYPHPYTPPLHSTPQSCRSGVGRTVFEPSFRAVPWSSALTPP